MVYDLTAPSYPSECRITCCGVRLTISVQNRFATHKRCIGLQSHPYLPAEFLTGIFVISDASTSATVIPDSSRQYRNDRRGKDLSFLTRENRSSCTAATKYAVLQRLHAES